MAVCSVLHSPCGTAFVELVVLRRYIIDRGDVVWIAAILWACTQFLLRLCGSYSRSFWIFVWYWWIVDGACYMYAILICTERWAKWFEKLLTIIWQAQLGRASAILRAASASWSSVGIWRCTTVVKAAESVLTAMDLAVPGEIHFCCASLASCALVVLRDSGGLSNSGRALELESHNLKEDKKQLASSTTEPRSVREERCRKLSGLRTTFQVARWLQECGRSQTNSE